MRGVEFQENYRLHYVTYLRLLDILRPLWPMTGPHLGRHGRPLSYPLEKAVCATLWYMGSGGCYRTVCHQFGFKKQTGWRAIRRVRDLLASLVPLFVKPPKG